MSINVYWACLEEEWLRAKEPENLLKNFLTNKNFLETSVKDCPMTKKYFKNMFYIRSIYDFEIFFNDDKIFSKKYNQVFFDNHVLLRSLNEKTLSFSQKFIFFTDQNSLEVSLFFPFLEDNNITKRCIVFPGKFDIGKWYRPIDFAIKLKNDYKSFKIEEEEIFYYIKFETEKKINFIQYRTNDMLKNYIDDFLNCKNNSNKIKSIENFYNMSKNKKNILKEIQKNIV